MGMMKCFFLKEVDFVLENAERHLILAIVTSAVTIARFAILAEIVVPGYVL